MAKTFDVTIDGDKYELKKFNLGQLKELTKVYTGDGAAEAGFEVFSMAFQNVIAKNGQPCGPVDGNELTPDMNELKAALDAILTAAGMRQKVEDGQTGEALAPATGQNDPSRTL